MGVFPQDSGLAARGGFAARHASPWPAGLLFPEFQAIDSLVIRDYYHRYTVDEHSLVTIENLAQPVRRREANLDRRFRDILSTLDHPELLYLSLLFHDVGKGMPNESHVEGSLEAVKGVFERLHLDSFGRETVTFLIGNHLRMSATLLRRDIFDPEAVHDFAQTVGTIEHLKMLTLFTYADIKAVNPEALTTMESGDVVATLRRHGKLSESFGGRSALVRGRRRCTATGAPDPHGRGRGRSGAISEFSGWFSEALFADAFLRRKFPLITGCTGGWDIPSAEISVTKRDEYYELVLVTKDRPFLFAKIAGTISSWGMNILKADACANKNGIVLDVLRFSDRFQTLDHNPSEMTAPETAIGRRDFRGTGCRRPDEAKISAGKASAESSRRYAHPFGQRMFLAQHGRGDCRARPARASVRHQFHVCRTRPQYRRRA